MDEEAKQKEQNRQSAVRREMERKSRDIIRIYNPLDQRFKWLFDGYPYTIEPKSTKDVERYIARLYFDKMSQYIIGQMGLSQGEGLIAERAKKGLPDFLDKYEENRAVWDKVPRLDDRKLLEKLASELILGLVEEYGFDIEPEVEKPISKADMRTLQEQVFDTMDKKIASDMPPADRPIKENITQEVSLE